MGYTFLVGCQKHNAWQGAGGAGLSVNGFNRVHLGCTVNGVKRESVKYIEQQSDSMIATREPPDAFSKRPQPSTRDAEGLRLSEGCSRVPRISDLPGSLTLFLSNISSHFIYSIG